MIFFSKSKQVGRFLDFRPKLYKKNLCAGRFSFWVKISKNLLKVPTVKTFELRRHFGTRPRPMSLTLYLSSSDSLLLDTGYLYRHITNFCSFLPLFWFYFLLHLRQFVFLILKWITPKLFSYIRSCMKLTRISSSRGNTW